MNKTVKITALFLLILFLSSCASSINVNQCIGEDTYGFWSGLWHGFIAPVAFIVSLFNDEVAVFAVNNNGGWYTFGFLLGVGGFSYGSSR
jgi:hypothetical protein